ncbi:DUF4240 domain-containing protein [Hymenobacter glacieicola]|uniref:DUF4240 domain-containing protein n=1 Tax=Hymenobacter glacieicola TaxID=1562124 RepID=A0ABQ1WEG3_9BACT|nr:DUF4240 domain-containing protein [Hymenobacter glacieicola]GGG27621.1 hypothetical protein GCM10011378_00570 [Hymenobacter glacieicola]
MDKNEFWQIIDSTKQASQGDQQRQQQALISCLESYPPEQILEFECQLRQHVLEADTFLIMAAQKIIDGYVSEDPYLYFRCWLVGQGEAVFTEALRNPDSLAALLEEPYQEFEALLYVAGMAYAARTGKQTEDDTFPRAVAITRGLDYADSVTKGEDWTENQLPKMLPRLWRKFGTL